MTTNQTKLETFKHGVEDRNAYCRDCTWSCHSLNSNVIARTHAKSKNHAVDVYTETRTAVKLINVNKA